MEAIKKESIQSASGSSFVIGKGTVKLPFVSGAIVEAYHTPNCSTNIIFVDKLSRIFKLTSRATIRLRRTLALA